MVPKLRLAIQILVACCLIIATRGAASEGATNTAEAHRCGYRWTIPPQHIGLLPSLRQLLPGGGTRSSFNVHWSSGELAKNVPGYRTTVEKVDTNILISVYVNSRERPDLIDGSPGSALHQIFTRSGEIHGEYVVEANPHPPGLYRIVHPDRKGPGWWVSKVDPRDHDTYVPVRDWLVASCSWMGGILPDTEKFVVCTFRPRIAQDIMISVNLSGGHNIKLHEEVIAHMARELRSWVTIPDDDPDCFDDPFEGFP